MLQYESDLVSVIQVIVGSVPTANLMMIFMLWEGLADDFTKKR